MSVIGKAAAIGGGVIGAGWVARLLLNGIDVSIYDPDPEAARKVGEVMKGARRAYRKMLPDGLPKEGKLTFAKTIAFTLALSFPLAELVAGAVALFAARAHAGFALHRILGVDKSALSRAAAPRVVAAE